MSKNVFMVCGLGFGDEGKGSIVDYLCRKYPISMVVRFNGSSNAAHNVVANGFHHTFSQFGSGTLVPGVQTYLSMDVCFDPASLVYEIAALKKIGVEDALSRLTVDPECFVVTPYHRILCRFKERARGSKHGSTGVGLNEAVTEYLGDEGGFLQVKDLLDPTSMRAELKKIRERAVENLPESMESELPTVEFCVDFMSHLAKNLSIQHLDPSFMYQGVVFEGAQGALLDEEFGFFPHVTRSKTSLDWAHDCVNDFVAENCRKIGVMRSYTTRHGAGPFPTELPYHSQEDHNGDHPYQGTFRSGHLDLALMKYGLAVSGADEIALTHVDRISPRVCVGYNNFDLEYNSEATLKDMMDVTVKLESAKPLYVNFPEDPKSIIHNIERHLECPIKILSRGQGPEHKEER